ncbi:hypothetical protein BJ508DRAFT_195613, partial [Ascobolus immersus RN42]
VECGHRYCEECLGQFFVNATKDRSAYPPQCCNEPLVAPTDTQFFTTQTRLSTKEIFAYARKAVEYDDPNPVYCHIQSCGSYLLKSSYRNSEVALCYGHPTTMETCIHCGKAAHGKVECSQDKDLKLLLDLAAEEKWMRCYKCKSMVEKTAACNHI